MRTPGEPHSYPNRTLLCVSGMTPQIITETLQALLERSPAFVPTRIHVLTTSEGERRAREALLDNARLAALCSERGIETPPVDFTLIRDGDGTVLADIRDGADNTAAGDCILALVRTLAQDGDGAIHAMLAGGRKTMSHFMGYALSLFGRAQDQLSHVLVAPEWAERAADFFYKPQPGRELQDREGGFLGHSDDVTVTLADIPLLRLGDALPRQLREGRASFSETVRLANLALGPATLRIDLRRRLAECSGIAVELSPANFAFLAWLAIRCEAEQEGIALAEWTDPEVEQYLAVFAAVVGYHDPDSAAIGHDRYEEAERTLRCDTLAMPAERQKKVMKARGGYLTSRRGDLFEILVRHLGEPLAARFVPPAGQKRNSTRYFLDLPPSAITIHGTAGLR